MGLLDNIKGTIGSALGSVSVAALPGIINQVYPGGLPGLLNQLQSTGYGRQVDSWLGHGPNDPINGSDLEHVLGNEHVKQLEQKLGIPADQVLDTVAKALPGAVDKASPNGKMPAPTAGS